MAPIEITIKADPSDLLPLLIALLRDESGRTPAPPFSSPFSRGVRIRGPFKVPADMVSNIDGLLREVSNLENLQALLQILTREAGEGDKTPAAPPEGPEGSDAVQGTATPRGPEGFDLEEDFMIGKGDL